ncbi:hypothetical protein FCH28_11370 [Streptomyces piniterrae]|uniref:Uncharacterized protein n=1 Tax=Streptomyces piniterrae TaxID=2571125 RepID=A0A4U0NN89_9ACTN|nr:hypothetical protein [Streptomyces piniterrae]TJZ55877.1 hypothetical protein FCH28_11370 [Streptomyces piniterrae]
MSLFRSRSDAQTSEVEQLQAQAREDYRSHNSPEKRAAAREQAGQARSHGNAAAGAWRGHK